MVVLNKKMEKILSLEVKPKEALASGNISKIKVNIKKAKSNIRRRLAFGGSFGLTGDLCMLTNSPLVSNQRN